MLVGAIAQSIPDIDFLATFWSSESGDILSHRGFTHSFLFGFLATLLLSALCSRYLRKWWMGWRTWFLLIGLNIAIHLLIDTCNAYGLGLLEPFNDRRFSFHILFVADPLFSIWPFFAFVALLIMKIKNPKRKYWSRLGIAMSIIYLCYALFNKTIIESDIKKSLVEQGLPSEKILVTPTPFNSLLWYAVAKDKNGYHVTYRSVLGRDKPIRYTYFSRKDSLKKLIRNKEEMEAMIGFADDFYTLEKRKDTMVLYVLRFGQVTGWHDPTNKFAFYYYLDCPGANELVTQRGRFENWNRTTLKSFWRNVTGR